MEQRIIDIIIINIKIIINSFIIIFYLVFIKHDKMLSINKPKFDLRTFCGGQLTNGVKYVLINDTSLEKSYVSGLLNSIISISLVIQTSSGKNLVANILII